MVKLKQNIYMYNANLHLHGMQQKDSKSKLKHNNVHQGLLKVKINISSNVKSPPMLIQSLGSKSFWHYEGEMKEFKRDDRWFLTSGYVISWGFKHFD